jgi:hypothetical protein
VAFTLCYSDGVQVGWRPSCPWRKPRYKTRCFKSQWQWTHCGAAAASAHVFQRVVYSEGKIQNHKRPRWLAAVRPQDEGDNIWWWGDLRERNENDLKAPDGTVINSFEWCSRSLRVKGIETVSIADIQALESPTECIPSLASLAYQKHFKYLQTKACSWTKQPSKICMIYKVRVNPNYELHSATAGKRYKQVLRPQLFVYFDRCWKMQKRNWTKTRLSVWTKLFNLGWFVLGGI